jgi:hypothetical protein
MRALLLGGGCSQGVGVLPSLSLQMRPAGKRHLVWPEAHLERRYPTGSDAVKQEICGGDVINSSRSEAISDMIAT